MNAEIPTTDADESRAYMLDAFDGLTVSKLQDVQQQIGEQLLPHIQDNGSEWPLFSTPH
ncbi:MAG: hypothetical protein N2663_02645 [Chlorobi bacterium]|nr:hypothetical protein [Chlorobiota bacterium]